VDQLDALEPSGRITDNVYDALRGAILTGSLEPGSKLSVPDLARQLDVSRSPVREAVLRLTQDRLAVETPRRGVEVAQVDTDELADLYEVRAALEGVAARLATERADPALVPALTKTVKAHSAAVRAGDVTMHVELDMAFHQTLRNASGNAHVIRMLDEIQTLIRLAMNTTTVTGGPAKALKDHQAILRAVRSGDATAAEQAAREHIVRLAGALRGRAAAT
jgi:DNA-binding GntR family transcriptional regulator